MLDAHQRMSSAGDFRADDDTFNCRFLCRWCQKTVTFLSGRPFQSAERQLGLLEVGQCRHLVYWAHTKITYMLARSLVLAMAASHNDTLLMYVCMSLCVCFSASACLSLTSFLFQSVHVS